MLRGAVMGSLRSAIFALLKEYFKEIERKGTP